MLVGVLSDTHLPRGGRRLPEACLARLRAADLVLHAGDLVAASVLDELERLGPPVRAVHGNMDEPALQARLPATLVVEAAGLRIGVIHDPGPPAGRRERLLARFPGCAAVVYGHTHLPEVVRAGGVWLLNPGSPTERRRAAAHTMLELVVEAGGLRPQLAELP
ncbi:MAG TPA: metallophosphoesterase family protein [Gaiellaceae bacterium]|nr:metallophosphoesterase family protein [Gaiellaceae bacterium]